MGGCKSHVAVLDTGCCSGVGSVGYSAGRYCRVAGHDSRSSLHAALTENRASWIQSDFCLKSCLLFRHAAMMV